MTEHTKQPYTLDETGFHIEAACTPRHPITIATMAAHSCDKPDLREEQRANAAFVLEAITNYEAILEAARAVVDARDRADMWNLTPLGESINSLKSVISRKV